MAQMLAALLATALIQVLYVLLRSKFFAMFRIIIIQNAFSLPLLLLSWTGCPWRATRQDWHIRRQLSGGKEFHRPVETFCTVLNVKKRVPSTYLLDFGNTAFPTLIAVNSANICICNEKNMYGTFRPASASKVVATIGVQNNVPGGIGTVMWCWKDDKGNDYTYQVHDVHYFSSSLVNILDITAFAK